MDRKGYIYLITNTLNNRCYVGQTCLPDIRRRFRGHLNTAKRGSQAPLHVDMRNYGESSFKVEQLCYVPLSSLDNMEAYWAEQLGTYITEISVTGVKGYNVRNCGEEIGSSLRGKTLSEEHKEKMRQAHVGRVQTEEHNQKARINRITSMLERGANGVKLSKQDVLTIVSESTAGKSQTEIAAKYTVQISVISRILSGDRWGYVTGIKKREPAKRTHPPIGMAGAETIRSLYASNEYSYDKLADMYSVNKSTIANIMKNKLYPTSS